MKLTEVKKPNRMTALVANRLAEVKKTEFPNIIKSRIKKIEAKKTFT
jgi:hypothetical protein